MMTKMMKDDDDLRITVLYRVAHAPRSDIKGENNQHKLRPGRLIKL